MHVPLYENNIYRIKRSLESTLGLTTFRKSKAYPTLYEIFRASTGPTSLTPSLAETIRVLKSV